jgi:hypothetical protein
MGWAAFRLIFSQTHLVTLLACNLTWVWQHLHDIYVVALQLIKVIFVRGNVD